MRTAFKELTQLRTAEQYLEPGFFSWDLAQGKIYADGNTADIFGHDLSLSASGLSLEHYLDRVHPEHRGRMARSIADTLMHGVPYHETYPVQRGDDFYHDVTVIGRCFRTTEGVPLHCSGVVIPHAEDRKDTDQILVHCLAVYDLAITSGNERLANQMLAVLASVNDMSAATGRLQ
ncbi:PAS domain-containing protein [Limoniibacter endophyticus]|nr:PAS domain-containing protein [Limoniibacter endophyticus]